MKKLLAVAGSFLALGAAAPAFDSNQEFKKFLGTEEPRLAKSFENKDPKVYESDLTADFRDKSQGKVSDRKTSIAQMKQAFAAAKSIKCMIKVLSAKVSGNTGTALTSGRLELVLNPMDNTGKTHTMVMEEVQRETWVRVGKTWKLRRTEEAKPTKMTVDGKPMRQ